MTDGFQAAAEAIGMGKAPCGCPPMQEMRAALAARNDLARECADLNDQVNDLAEQVEALRPLAIAGREYVAVVQALESHEPGFDGDDARQAWDSLKDAAEAWWDR